MASVTSQLIEEVTAHAQSDSLEDAREICAEGTYFPNNLRPYTHTHVHNAYIHTYIHLYIIQATFSLSLSLSITHTHTHTHTHTRTKSLYLLF